MNGKQIWPWPMGIISALGLILALLLASCGGGDSSANTPATPPPITVTISFPGDPISAGTSNQFQAQVANDPSGMGAKWTLSPASGAGSMANVTSTSMTYVAPTSTPTKDINVTVTATSLADPSQSATVNFTVPAIQVVVDPNGATVPAATNQTFKASILFDSNPKPSGVTWALVPASGAGTLSDATSTSVTYHAPAVAPDSDQQATLTATSIENPLSSTSVQITVPAIQIAVDPSSATLKAGDSQAFTATVNYDPSPNPGGVIWALTPASGAGTLNDVTSTSVTYHAPAIPPPSNQQVTLTATAIDNAQSSTPVPITVLAIAVGVAPASALVPIGAKLTLKATADNDPANAGITWSLTQGAGNCSPACGSISAVDASTASYTAPATLPTSSKVTAIATSATDTTKSDSSAITLSAGSVQLVPFVVDFGKVSHSVSRPITLTNVGSAALDISGISIGGAGGTAFTYANGCGNAVAVGNSCDITVTFAGSCHTTGISCSRGYTAELLISDSSADSPQHVRLTGTACRKNGCKTTTMAVRTALAATTRIAAPRPTGPNAVGARTVSLTDSTRADPLQKNASRRELLVRFWYPTAAKHRCRNADYASPAVWSYFSQLAAINLPAVVTNSCQDAPVQDGAYPVVVFTHGYTGTFTDYTYLFEELASRGYIVASVNHTYEATATALADGRLLKSVFGSHIGGPMRADRKSLGLALSARLADLKFVAGQLDRLNRDPASPLSGHLDTARMAVAGHSLGGLTALEALQQDERFRAAVSIDGLVPDASFGPVSRPVLILDAGRESWPPEERHLWAQLKGPRFAVNLKKAEHIAPTDEGWLARGAVRTGRMTPEQTVAAVRDYITAFLDSQLQGKPADRLLTRASAKYPGAELTAPSR